RDGLGLAALDGCGRGVVGGQVAGREDQGGVLVGRLLVGVGVRWVLPLAALVPYTTLFRSQRRAAAGAGHTAGVGVTAVGDLVGEAVGAAVVGGRGVGAGGAAAAQAAVAGAADDGVGQVGIRGLDVTDQGTQVDGAASGVLG